jgi:hypothetical protein
MPISLKPSPAVPGSVTTTIGRLYCDKKQLAEAFDVSLRTIANWQAQRVLPYIKVGGAVRFDLEQCREVVRKRLTRHESPNSGVPKPRKSSKWGVIDRVKDVFRKNPKISPADAAAISGVHLATAYRAREILIAAREIPA